MPTRKTIFWLLAGAALYFIAWNVGSGWLYILAAAVVAVPLASLPLAWFNTHGLRMQLKSPGEAIQDDHLEAFITVSNRSLLPRFLIQLQVNFAGCTTRILVPSLDGHSSRQLSIALSGIKRGVYPMANISISSGAPFGIVTSRRRQITDCPLVVYPRSYRLSHDWATGQGSAGYMLASNVPTRRTGGDYLGVRDYRPEDSPRSIHWRTTARAGVLSVIEYAHQVAINPVVIVDNWREADFGSGANSSFETAVSIAASLIGREAMHNRRFAVGSSIAETATGGMSHQAEPALRWLSGVQADRSRPLDLEAGQLAWPGATPVIILSSHKSYARVARSDLLTTNPHSVLIMLDWRGLEPDGGRRSLMMADDALATLSDQIEGHGGRFVLIETPTQVERCLSDL